MHRIVIVIGSLVLTACTQAQLNVIDQLAQNDTEHALAFVSEPVSEASSPEYVAPSSSVEPLPSVPPPEPCTEGLFRVYYCIDGFKQYI